MSGLADGAPQLYGPVAFFGKWGLRVPPLPLRWARGAHRNHRSRGPLDRTWHRKLRCRHRKDGPEPPRGCPQPGVPGRAFPATEWQASS